jgi:DNA polymerase-3 subunit delta
VAAAGARRRGERTAARVQLILGADSFLAERALEALVKQVLGGAPAPDALETLRGDETSWARVLDSARTPSLFAPSRLIVVRNADALKGDGEGVAEYLDNPTPGIWLALVAAKVDRRRSVWKRVAERGEIVSADPLRGARLRTFVQEEVRERRLKLPPEVFEELLERVGQDLRRLVGEIDKLEAYAHGREDLSVEEAGAVLGRGLAPPLYVLADAFSAQDLPRCLALLEALVEEREEPLRLLGTLHRAARQMLAGRALKGVRLPREELAARLGLPPPVAFKAPDVLVAAARWNQARLDGALAALARADRRMKTGLDGRTALELGVVEALRSGGSGGVRPAPRGR